MRMTVRRMLREVLVIGVAALVGYVAACIHVAFEMASNPRDWAELAVDGETNLSVIEVGQSAETDVPRGE